MSDPSLEGRVVLSVCTRCRDGREDSHGDVRGGARLAGAIARAAAGRGDLPNGLAVRGVACMSQCRRPCTIALSGHGRFTYVFGDLDPHRHAHAVLDVLAPYAATQEGFLARGERPEPLRAGILGRIPPIPTTSPLVGPLFREDLETPA
ncbi:DUF1636 family protein [Salinarimonas rosea]|uniref:DUF1636 family protein n=1 Tax=Salinarimonas rosea TaxID=552063 RepID=UPI0004040868|nr:DUF1636 domain-containing protein [Salinarimonas rosea]